MKVDIRTKKLSHAGITWFVYSFLLGMASGYYTHIGFFIFIIAIFLTIGNFIIVELMEVNMNLRKSNRLKQEELDLIKKKMRRKL